MIAYRGDLNLPEVDTFANLRFSSEVQPAFEGKVDALRTIESHIETRMITPRVRYHKLSFVLNQVIRAAGGLR